MKSIKDNVRQIDFWTTSTLTFKGVLIFEKIKAIFTIPQPNLQNRTVYWSIKQCIYTTDLAFETDQSMFSPLVLLSYRCTRGKGPEPTHHTNTIPLTREVCLKPNKQLLQLLHDGWHAKLVGNATQVHLNIFPYRYWLPNLHTSSVFFIYWRFSSFLDFNLLLEPWSPRDFWLVFNAKHSWFVYFF